MRRIENVTTDLLLVGFLTKEGCDKERVWVRGEDIRAVVNGGVSTTHGYWKVLASAEEAQKAWAHVLWLAEQWKDS